MLIIGTVAVGEVAKGAARAADAAPEMYIVLVAMLALVGSFLFALRGMFSTLVATGKQMAERLSKNLDSNTEALKSLEESQKEHTSVIAALTTEIRTLNR